jgi:hypothetical protein
MFESIKNKMKLGKMQRLAAFLLTAQTVTPDGAFSPVGYGLIPQKDAAELLAAEPTLFIVNPNVAPDAEGKVQAALTAAGLAAVQAAPAVEPAKANVSSVPSETATFEIRSNVPLPTIQRGGGAGRVSKYPFDKLEVGQSFFIPGITTKSFASTINGQNRKGKNADPKRAFTVRTENENGVAGVGVWRVEYKEKVKKEKPATPAA